MFIRNIYKNNFIKNFLNTQKRFILDFDPKKDYYKILGIGPEANEKEIKLAYYKMAKLHHPDLNAGKSNNEFKEMTNAYDILSDPKKKEEYDTYRKTGGFGSNDNFYGNYYNSAQQNKNYGNYTNKNNNYNPFEEIFKNKSKGSSSNSYTKYEYKDPKTGEWKSYTSTQGNPFFKDFEDFFRKSSQNNKARPNHNDQADQGDPFKNYWERNKNYDYRFKQKNEEFYNENYFDQNKSKGYNPFSQQNTNQNPNQNDNNFNYDYTPILFYQFLRKVFIFTTAFMIFSLFMRNRYRNDYYFNNTYGGYNPNYGYSQYPGPNGSYIPGGIPTSRPVDDYDPYDPRASIKIK